MILSILSIFFVVVSHAIKGYHTAGSMMDVTACHFTRFGRELRFIFPRKVCAFSVECFIFDLQLPSGAKMTPNVRFASVGSCRASGVVSPVVGSGSSISPWDCRLVL